MADYFDLNTGKACFFTIEDDIVEIYAKRSEYEFNEMHDELSGYVDFWKGAEAGEKYQFFQLCLGAFFKCSLCVKTEANVRNMGAKCNEIYNDLSSHESSFRQDLLKVDNDLTTVCDEIGNFCDCLQYQEAHEKAMMGFEQFSSWSGCQRTVMAFCNVKIWWTLLNKLSNKKPDEALQVQEICFKETQSREPSGPSDAETDCFDAKTAKVCFFLVSSIDQLFKGHTLKYGELFPMAEKEVDEWLAKTHMQNFRQGLRLICACTIARDADFGTKLKGLQNLEMKILGKITEVTFKAHEEKLDSYISEVRKKFEKNNIAEAHQEALTAYAHFKRLHKWGDDSLNSVLSFCNLKIWTTMLEFLAKKA